MAAPSSARWDVVGLGANAVDLVLRLPAVPQASGSFAKMRIGRETISCGGQMTTALVALFGMGLVSATAHTKFLNLASNIAALITLVIGGYVLWAIGLLMAVASIAGGQVGAHLALRVGGRVIRPLLVVMALALTVKLLADPGNPLTAWVMGAAA